MQVKTLPVFCKGTGALLKVADFPAQVFRLLPCKTVGAPQINPQQAPKLSKHCEGG